MNPRRLIALAVLFGGWASVAGALAGQAVYRCGNAYSNMPCSQGATVDVDVDDGRSPAQQAEARTVAAREAALAARMTADRESAEAQTVAKPGRAVRVKSAAPAASAPPRPLRRQRLPLRDNGQGDFVAVVPRPAKK